MSRGCCVLTLLVWLAGLSPASAQMAYRSIEQDEGFTPRSTCRTVAAGAVENPAIWSCGRVPARTDWAQVDHAVTLSSNWTVWTLFIAPTGHLANLGTGFTITIADTTPADVPQFDTGIIVEGTLRLIGAPKTWWTRTRAGIAEGARVVEVETCDGWRVGDRLVVGDTREQTVDVPEHAPEVGAIAGLVGCTVTLATPLGHAYTTARDHAGVVERLIPIGNLTRDITIRSEHPNGSRGHIMLTGMASVSLLGVSTQDMGRTTLATLDPVLNHIGRYALHCHHLHTAGAVSVIGTVVERSLKWGYTVHASDGNTFRDNLAYDVQGWGFGTEDGTEVDNVFERNLAILVRGIGGDYIDNRGVGFWMRGPRNILIGNVVVNAAFDGFAVYDTAPLRNVLVFNTFRDNEAIATPACLTLWGVASATTTSLIEHFMEWHCDVTGVYAYGVNNIEFRDLYSRSDPNYSQAAGTRRGTYNYFGDYDAVAMTFTRPNIQNKDTGFYLPYGATSPQAGVGERLTRFVDGYYYNTTDFLIMPQSLASAIAQPIRVEVIRPTHGNAFGTHYEKRFHGDGDLRARYRLLVTDYQRVAGDSFEVFGDAQDQNFPMPQTAQGVVGCPVAGLTNLGCLYAHGVTMFGEITPASAVTRSRIAGKIVPIGATTEPAPLPLPPVRLRAPANVRIVEP